MKCVAAPVYHILYRHGVEISHIYTIECAIPDCLAATKIRIRPKYERKVNVECTLWCVYRFIRFICSYSFTYYSQFIFNHVCVKSLLFDHALRLSYHIHKTTWIGSIVVLTTGYAFQSFNQRLRVSVISDEHKWPAPYTKVLQWMYWQCVKWTLWTIMNHHNKACFT